MIDINKVFLMGRLGADPVQRETKTGLAVVHFPMATSRLIQAEPSVASESSEASDEGSEQPPQQPTRLEETQWHRVVVWGKQGERCARYLKKGEPVHIEGSIRTRKYNAKSGEEKFTFEVHAEKVNFLPYRSRSVEAQVAVSN